MFIARSGKEDYWRPVLDVLGLTCTAGETIQLYGHNYLVTFNNYTSVMHQVLMTSHSSPVYEYSLLCDTAYQSATSSAITKQPDGSLCSHRWYESSSNAFSFL